MNPEMAKLEVENLRKMTVDEADRRLCRMTIASLHDIAAAIGIRLPTFGGDKPNIIIGQLKLRRY